MFLEYEVLGECSAAMNHQWRKSKRRKRVLSTARSKGRRKRIARSVTGYPPKVMPVGSDGKWNFDDPEGTVYYKKCYRDNHSGGSYRWFKRFANKRVRQFRGDLSGRNDYRRVFDLKWTID